MSFLHSACGLFRMRLCTSVPGTSVSRVPRACTAVSRRVLQASPILRHALFGRRFPSRKGDRERGR